MSGLNRDLQFSFVYRIRLGPKSTLQLRLLCDWDNPLRNHDQPMHLDAKTAHVDKRVHSFKKTQESSQEKVIIWLAVGAS